MVYAVKEKKKVRNEEKRRLPAGVKVSTAAAKIKKLPGTGNLYEVSLFLGRAAGKVKNHKRTIQGKPAANKAAAYMEAHREELLLQAITRAADAAAGPMLQEAIENYLKKTGSQWTPKTAAAKRYTLQHYVLGTLGNIPISSITSDMLEELQRTLHESCGLTKNTAAAVLRTAGAFFSTLFRLNKIQSNPAAKVKRYSDRPAPRAFWDAAQVCSALASAPLWLRLLLTTGCRPEELQALKWEAIDWQTGSIKIKASAYYDRQRRQWKTRDGVKSKASYRSIDLDAITLQALQDAAADAQPEGYVIAAPRGGIIPLPTLRLWLQRFAETQGLPAIPLYSLRHSSITYLLEQGTPVKTVAARAGHSERMTLERYAQVSDAAAKRAAALFAVPTASAEAAHRKEAEAGPSVPMPTPADATTYQQQPADPQDGDPDAASAEAAADAQQEQTDRPAAPMPTASAEANYT